jgi:6-phosphofructokinase
MAELAELDQHHAGNTLRLSQQLEKLTGLECRVSILGYVQRGGAPSAVDRLLATRLGTACADLIEERQFGVMVAIREHDAQPVPLEQVAGNRRDVPLDHAWIAAARDVGTCLGA